MHSSLSHAHSTRAGAHEGSLTVRRARPADDGALAKLAALDSARALTGERLVAEVDGRLVAAVSLHDGRAVADPFVPTADVVRILQMHTAGARAGRARPRRGLPRLMPRLAPRAA
jgi:hypothetical protein